MHLSCLHSHCNRNQGHKIHGFSPGAVSYKAWISGMSWSIISGLVCWVTFPHCSCCSPVMSKLWQFLILYICKGRLFFIIESVWHVAALHGVFHNMTYEEIYHSCCTYSIATSSKNIFWSHVLIWKKRTLVFVFVLFERCPSLRTPCPLVPLLILKTLNIHTFINQTLLFKIYRNYAMPPLCYI